jgi:hypothetical protein
MHDNSDASAAGLPGLSVRSIITQPADQRLPNDFLELLAMLDRQTRDKVVSRDNAS